MKHRPSGKRRRKPQEQELNITPIMNIFMIIVPFLLLTVSFAKIAVIEMNLPPDVKSESNSNVPDKPPEILTITVTGKGFKLDGIGEGILVLVAGEKDNLNYMQLTTELTKLKDQYPGSEEVIILFEPDIPYETVIKVMDASRETMGKPKRKLYPQVSVGEVEGEEDIK